jgi:uncharacterized protein
MAAFVFDASAIIKRYINEIGSGYVIGLVDPAAAHEIYLTRIARVEVAAAVTRTGRGGVVTIAAATALLTQFRHDATHQYNILEVTPAGLAAAERLAELHGLRGYDAVQLAATLELRKRDRPQG